VNGMLRRRRPRRLFAPSLVAVALVSSACTGSGVGSGPRSSPTTEQQNPTSPVRELSSIETLREAFNDDAGRTRLILIISPT
jgi:hypothetical protein